MEKKGSVWEFGGGGRRDDEMTGGEEKRGGRQKVGNGREKQMEEGHCPMALGKFLRLFPF